jgi:pimeloyl-ACP methyl ester carboxylesterase
MRLLKNNLKTASLLIIIILISFIFSAICCQPIKSGVQIQRKLLQFYGLKKKKLKTSHGYLTYFEGGKGQTMILVHGYIAEAGNWYTVVPDLKKKYNLVIPDLPGHGQSDPQTDKLTPDDLLNGILQLIENKSKTEKVILVGNSLGGWVCLMAALEAKEKISHLILENSAGLKVDLPERLLLPKDIESAKELYQMLLGDESPHAPDFLYEDLIKYLGQKRFIYLFHFISEKYFLDGKLLSLDIPVDLIWGGSDRLFNSDYARRLQNEIPGSNLVIVESTGHAMHFTKPDLFVEQIFTILK